MKVAVLASIEDGRILVDILQALASAGVGAYGLRIRRNWPGLAQAEIFARLEKADHYLAVLGPASLADSWIPFAAGFGIGSKLGLACYRLDPDLALPRYLAGLPILDSREELQAYYQAEQAEWLLRSERQQAKAALLELGISYHAASLAQCVCDGDTRAVELFLRGGFLPDARDKHGVTLLCLAARSKHLAVAQLLLESGADLDLQSEDRGYSPLMDAVLVGSPELVDLFLAKGADPDLLSKDGQTALVVAVGRGDADIARRLLEYGADADIADKLGLSARKYAALFKSPALAELFGLPSASPAPAAPAEGRAG
ncbi:MAG TPA: ankyrin repeat domain-containing protein [Spirochaetia bacterium]|nr:ankyrin repeat domain-containing protein [Spirochaetia bacterium]